MSPRRLIPYLLVFLALVGTYVGLRWHQDQKAATEKQAKLVFDFKTDEISAISLKRGAAEIQLTRQGAVWEITKPLKAKAEPSALEEMVKTLAQLRMERDLGPGEVKAFGLEPPGLVVSFTAKGEPHRVALGSPAPGGRGYYIRRDEGPNILLVATRTKDALDQQLVALRDKTLWSFSPEQVTALKIRSAKTQADLEKSGAKTWRWRGRPDFKVRSERLELSLQTLSEARIIGFPAAPKDLRAAGLAPQAKTEVTLVTPQGAQTLFLGAVSGQGIFGRVGAQGPVVEVSRDLQEQLTGLPPILEDRRLWSGSVREVHRVVWGLPGKTWTAVREKDAWKLSGPDKAAVQQPAPRLEMALVKFQKLEYLNLLPKAGAAGSPVFTLEFLDGAGKSLFRLEEMGKKGEAVEVRTKTGETTLQALVPQKHFAPWQAEMARLTAPPPQPPK